MGVLYVGAMLFFFFKQKTAYEMRISDWSSDVCSSDLKRKAPLHLRRRFQRAVHEALALEAQCINRRLLADRAQHVLQRSPFRSMMENVAHRHAAHAPILSQIVERAKPRKIAGPAPERQQIGRAHD